MSIRVRLTLWYVVLLCLGLAAFGIAVQWQVQYSASDALDSALRHRASDVVADLRTGSTLLLRQNATVLADHDLGEVSLWVRVLDAQGRVAIRQGPTVPMLSTRVLAEARPGFHDAKTAAGNHVRMYVFPVVHNGRRLATIQVITTTQQVEQGRDRLLAAMGLAGVAIVVLAAAGGLFLASRALRPVDRITRLAATIGDGDLHRRVSSERDGPTGARRGRNDELVRLARTFDGMLARLEEASERRRRLTADVAHELNTPIATIASGAEIALRHTRSPEEYQEVLRHTLDESRHMARVVDDLLLLARVEAGRLPLQHELVEIDEICRQTVKALGPLATERRIRLDIDVPATAILVVGDELRLAQVVRNLVDNALRYTPEGGAVQVSLRQKTDIGGSPVVELRVLDTGPGIEIAERDLIFDRFHRATGSDMSGGSGLGLAISKAIVLAHGGDIRVETGNGVDGSYYPGGAQFIVTLPEAGSTYFDA